VRVGGKLYSQVAGKLVPIAGTATKVGNSPVVLDLFGGKTSQIPGAINVDIIAEEGIRASATKLPFASGSVDEIIVSNPFMNGTKSIMDWLPSASKTLKPGGQMIINATKNNPYAQLPSASVLDSLGLRVVQQPSPLLPRFNSQVFRSTEGGLIANRKIQSIILEKVH